MLPGAPGPWASGSCPCPSPRWGLCQWPACLRCVLPGRLLCARPGHTRKCPSVLMGVCSFFTIVCSFMFDSNLLTVGFYVLFSISSSLLPLRTGFQRGVSARTATQCRRLGRVLHRAGGPDRVSPSFVFQFRESGWLWESKHRAVKTPFNLDQTGVWSVRPFCAGGGGSAGTPNVEPDPPRSTDPRPARGHYLSVPRPPHPEWGQYRLPQGCGEDSEERPFLRLR